MRRAAPVILCLAAMLWAYAYRWPAHRDDPPPRAVANQETSKWVTRKAPLPLPIGTSSLLFPSSSPRQGVEEIVRAATQQIERAEKSVHVIFDASLGPGLREILAAAKAKSIAVHLVALARDETFANMNASPRAGWDLPSLLVLAVDGKRTLASFWNEAITRGAGVGPLVTLEEESVARDTAEAIDRRAHPREWADDTAAPVTSSGAGFLLSTPAALRRALEEKLRSAEQSIDFVISPMADPTLASLLDERAIAGVRVRGVLPAEAFGWSRVQEWMLENCVRGRSDLAACYYVLDGKRVITHPPLPSAGATSDPLFLLDTSDGVLVRAFRDHFEETRTRGEARGASRLERALR